MKLLSRRTVLKGALGGAAVSLALPPLEAMLNSRGAYADGTTDAFFGVFFWANGLPWHAGHGGEQGGAGHPDLWTPTAVGPYTPTPLLQSLARHDVSVISGLTPTTEIPRTPPGQGDGHMRGFMVALTGDRPRSEGFDHPSHTLTARRESIDQYVARHPEFYGEAPQFRSLIAGVSTARFHDYGHWNAISYNGPYATNQPVMAPEALYDYVFDVPPDDGNGDGRRRSRAFDAVLEDARRLQDKLGVEDRQRVERHLEHVRSIQRRLDTTVDTCEPPTRPNASGDLLARTEAMAEILAVAIGCGLTRVFSFMLTAPATTHVFRNLGVPDGMHKTCHDGEWENVRLITLHQMDAFGRFLDRFDAIAHPAGGTVLDRGCIFGTSEYGEGWKHGVREFPVVLAGGANGCLARGMHVRDQGGSLSRAHLTALRAVGLSDGSFGFNGGETSQPFGELLL